MSDTQGGLQGALGHEFEDGGLLRVALTHASAAAEGAGPITFERLEFLGDAVLELAISDYLYLNYPDLPEGEMTKTRASVVNENVLADVAVALGVDEALLLGRGEEEGGGRNKPSILSDSLEAVLGALYLDAGFERARSVIVEHWGSLIESHVAMPGEKDFKTRLHELVAAEGKKLDYSFQEEGPDHRKTFRVAVEIDGQLVGTGTGSSKKRAQQEAARRSLESLGA
ncbi:MAG: ribonuclease III [Acidimicrobiia bacterium]|nr:ribonuclease III [Acidimicrobiia bacterium]